MEACANVVTPSGGPKDVKAPVVVQTTPPNHSKHFTGKSVRIDFNKFVKLTDASTQVMVSPFMNQAPEFKIKGRSIVANFSDTLKPNTTYSISFGKAIADINEGNVLLNYQYVFSTGNFIDSLTLKGVVKNALTQKPEVGVMVMLYEKNDDSLPYKTTPFYISKTDESGNFYFSGLKNGKFKMFALKDGNNDFMYDQPEEMIAFSDSLITPAPVDTAKADSLKKNRSYSLSLFEEISTKQKRLKASAMKYGRLLLVFRKPVEDFSVNSLSKDIPNSALLPEFSITKDTVTIWLKKPDADSLTMQVRDGVFLDTAIFKLVKKVVKQGNRKPDEVKGMGLIATVTNNGSFDFFKSIKITSFTPVDYFDFNKITVKENKDTVKAKFVFLDSIHRNIQMVFKFKEETNYTLFVPPGTFKDIYGIANDTLKIHFTTTATKNYGNIKLAIKSEGLKSSLIVQLVNDNDFVMELGEYGFLFPLDLDLLTTKLPNEETKQN